MNTPMSPNSGYVQKSAVRGLIVALFAFVLCIDAIGLVLVKNYAASQATDKAVAVATQANKARTYVANKTACGIRGLVLPAMAAERTQIKSYQDAVNEKGADPAKVARNKQRIKALNVQLASQKKVLEAFVTIPPDFDCSTLPKHPPRVPLPQT